MEPSASQVGVGVGGIQSQGTGVVVEGLVKGLIYPVPDPAFPFLGVHFTQTMKGFVEAGPNAVLATKREGYRKRDISLVELAGILAYPGFWRLALREWKIAAWEINRSFRKSVFVKSLQQLIPEVGQHTVSGRVLHTYQRQRGPGAATRSRCRGRAASL